jgi:hypothetical protein
MNAQISMDLSQVFTLVQEELTRLAWDKDLERAKDWYVTFERNLLDNLILRSIQLEDWTTFLELSSNDKPGYIRNLLKILEKKIFERLLMIRAEKRSAALNRVVS